MSCPSYTETRCVIDPAKNSVVLAPIAGAGRHDHGGVPTGPPAGEDGGRLPRVQVAAGGWHLPSLPPLYEGIGAVLGGLLKY